MPISPFVAKLRKKVGTDLLCFTGVSAVVLHGQREILLVHSKETDQWMPIGGMVEPGEEPADAAVREVLEETNVQVSIEKLAGVYDGPRVQYSNGDKTHYVTIVFLCQAISGDPHPTDGENFAARYFPMDQMPPMREDHQRNIKAALSQQREADFFARGR